MKICLIAGSHRKNSQLPCCFSQTEQRELKTLHILANKLASFSVESCCSASFCRGDSFTSAQVTSIRTQIWSFRSAGLLRLWENESCSFSPSKVFLDGKRVCFNFLPTFQVIGHLEFQCWRLTWHVFMCVISLAYLGAFTVFVILLHLNNCLHWDW